MPDSVLAVFKHAYLLVRSNDARFDRVRSAGVGAAKSGIYRCHACGTEVVAARGQLLPGGDHHKHPAGMDPIKWRLVVCVQG